MKATQNGRCWYLLTLKKQQITRCFFLLLAVGITMLFLLTAVSVNRNNVRIQYHCTACVDSQVGKMEYEQAMRLWGKRMTRGQKYSKLYKYRVSYAINQKDMVIYLKIVETYKGKATRGGSSFRIVQTSNSFLNSCSFIDHFNGQYMGKCQIKEQGCSNVVVVLIFVDYCAYRDIDQLDIINRVIFNKKICFNNKQLHFNTTDIKEQTNIWYRVPPGKWVWMEDGVVIDKMDRSEACRCIQSKYDNIIWMGSSHARFNADYTWSYCLPLKNITRKHGSYKLLNVELIQSRYIFQQVQTLKELDLKSRNSTDKNLLIFQFGAWDLYKKRTSHGTGHKHLLNKAIPQLVNALEELLTSSSAWGRARIIWLTPVPYPDITRMGGRQFRNNHVLAAAIYKFSNAIKHLPIEVLDVFSMLYPRNLNHVCEGHYLCRNFPYGTVPSNSTGEFIGELGFQVMDYIMHRVCGWD